MVAQSQRLDIEHARARAADPPKKLFTLTKVIGKFAPLEYSAYGLFSFRKCSLNIGHSTYGDEFSHLYVTQGFITDRSIQLLQTTRFSITLSEDCPAGAAAGYQPEVGFWD